MCAELIADEHEHVVNVDSRNLMCTCRGCWLLFTSDGAGGGRYRAVHDRYAVVDNFAISAQRWAELQIPVSVAFFFRNSSIDQVAAFYPGPARATESLLPLDAWADLLEENPVLASMEPDIEALLIRAETGSHEAYIVPIDACYELAGHLRLLWRGFDGGSEARRALDGFFANVKAKAR